MQFSERFVIMSYCTARHVQVAPSLLQACCLAIIYLFMDFHHCHNQNLCSSAVFVNFESGFFYLKSEFCRWRVRIISSPDPGFSRLRVFFDSKHRQSRRQSRYLLDCLWSKSGFRSICRLYRYDIEICLIGGLF